MAVKLTHQSSSNDIILIAGYEGGFTAAHRLGISPHTSSQAPVQPMLQFAETIYLSQPHTQPVLSLDASPSAKVYFTSSADAVIAAHRMPDMPLNIDQNKKASLDAGTGRSTKQLPTPETSTSGLDIAATSSTEGPGELQSALAAAAAEDHGRGLPTEPSSQPSTARSQESSTVSVSPVAETSVCTLATQTSHQGVPAAPATNATLFSKKNVPSSPSNSTAASPKPSGLSSLLSKAPAQSTANQDPPVTTKLTVQAPYKFVHTKHAGQQSLRVRSDGRLLVTAGWDSRVRIYSSKTLRELAVLKWHKEGVYAADFADILHLDPSQGARVHVQGRVTASPGILDTTDDGSRHVAVSSRESRLGGLRKLQQQREEQIQTKHWVVAGAKDGKVSLWEVF